MPEQTPQPEQPQILPGINVNLDLGRLLQEVERPELDGRMVSVASSMVSAAGYNLASQEMTVLFTNGRQYTYQGVPVEVYDGLMQAGSVGEYMRANVIDVFGF